MECYDLFISVGSACRPAYHLSINDLRNEAYPLDWQMAYSLDTFIHLFKTKFVDFFIDIKEDNVEWNGSHRWIKDIKNNIISIHNFSRDIDLEIAQKEFLKQTQNRFKRLDVKLKEARRVVLICNRTDTIDQLSFFLNEFSALYPHLIIKLINIRNNEEIEANSYQTETYRLSDSLSIEQYHFNDTFNSITNEKFDWHGNIGVWRTVLKNYYNASNFETMQTIKNESKSLVIYGAGKRCLDLLDKFDKYNIQIKSIAVSEILNNPKSIRQYDVNVIEKCNKDDMIVISLADRNEAEKIRNTLISKGYHNLFFFNKNWTIEKAY